MLRINRRRPSPAMLVSVMALFLALGGGYAVASSHGTKSKKIAKVVRRLAPGLSVSHANTANTAGTADNANKLGGQAASNYVQYGTLPSGHTETGVFGIRMNVPASSDQPDDSITFPMPLASAPISDTDSCTGTVSDPTAPPGHLCFYIGQVANVSAFAPVNPETGDFGTSRFGFDLTARSAAAGDKIFRGTWAVTAP
jgi:hypothetical protein